MDLYEAIYAQIGLTAAVTAIVGSGDNARAYPVKATQGTAAPYLVWRTLSAPCEHTMHSDAGNPVTHRVIFRSYAETLAEALELAAAVDVMFSAFNAGGTLGGEGGLAVNGIAAESEPIDDWNPDAGTDGLFEAEQDFMFFYLRG